MEGLPGVADRSWPCAPLDLPRSPAWRAGSGRFTISYLPETHVPLELERLARLISDLDGDMETVRERVFM